MFTKRQSAYWILPVILLSSMLFSPIGLQPALARGNATATSNTWYVATTGSDSNSCSTVDAPCLTINGALGKASDGDTIDVAVGMYTAASGTEVVLINKSITLSGGWDATFATQSGLSTIDGETARRGVMIDGHGILPTVNIDLFVIQNGDSLADNGGGIYNSYSTLNLTRSIVRNNSSGWSGGGIYTIGTLTVNDSAISNNTTGDPYGGGGGGIKVFGGTTTLNRTTLSGNETVVASCVPYSGSAIDGPATLNDSTVSSNIGTYAITDWQGSIILNNTTVSGNGCGGIANGGAVVSLNNSTIVKNGTGFTGSWGAELKNSILAGNTHDCSGNITSDGYNLIGNNSGCTLTPVTGDQVGTLAAPINARLLPLGNNGGPTFTQALASNSPALDAGNPATPGSGGNACLATDQRGVSRPVGAACDIGAFEGHYAAVAFINRANPNPTSASLVAFTVIFSEAVTGVDLTDFVLTKTGVTGAFIQSVSGSGKTYTATVATGGGNGTIRLDLIDNDTILDGSSNPLGGVGLVNGDFKSGQVYTVSKIPVPISPVGSTWDTTPTYKWSTVPLATQYRYQLIAGTTVIYTNLVTSTACGPAACFATPITLLIPGVYKWHVQALLGGVWRAYGPFAGFTLYAPKAGYWSGSGLDFYVTPSRVQISKFSIYIDLTRLGCGKYKVTHIVLIPITNAGTFSFTGPFHANGAFGKAVTSPGAASGSTGLSSFFISGCGYITGGPFSWSAGWRNTTQPAIMSTQDNMPFVVTPSLDAPFNFLPLNSFSLQP